jgi:hypothetical protein
MRPDPSNLVPHRKRNFYFAALRLGAFRFTDCDLSLRDFVTCNVRMAFRNTGTTSRSFGRFAAVLLARMRSSASTLSRSRPPRISPPP